MIKNSINIIKNYFQQISGLRDCFGYAAISFLLPILIVMIIALYKLFKSHCEIDFGFMQSDAYSVGTGVDKTSRGSANS